MGTYTQYKSYIIYVYTYNKSQIYYLIVTSLNHEQCWLVLLNSDIERRKGTAMLLRCVQQDGLVHSDAYGQPGP